MHNLSKHNSLLLLILILIGLQFLFLVSYAPFLHNHPANEPERDSCPAFIISIELVTATIFLLFIIVFLFPFVVGRIFLINDQIVQKYIFSSIPSRSPPFFS